MSAEYTNRRGDVYYLLQGKTKTGKPKYYCSRKLSGETVESMPAGFEWHENSDTAIVSVRKVRTSHILSIEREMLDEAVRLLAKLEYFLIEQNVDDLTVLLPDRDPEEAMKILEMISPFASYQSESQRDWLIKSSRYSPLLRFVLTDPVERLFVTQRWCFRGRIDNWIVLSPPSPLPELMRAFVPHLGQESFFDLI